MSIQMTPDEVLELAKMMDASAPQADSTPETKQEALAPKVTAQEDGQTTDQTVQAKPDEEDNIRPVPYNRFKEVNSKYQAEKARAEELAAKLEAFASTKDEPDDDDGWLQEFLGGKETKKANTEDVPQWAKGMQAKLAEYESEKAQSQLDKVLTQAAIDYPDLPQGVLLSGIANGSSIEAIANTWDWMGQQYMARKGAQPASTQPKADVAPRLPASKGKVNAPEPPSHAKTWSENSKRVQEWFKTQG